MDLSKLFEKRKDWLIIREGVIGLECYADKDLKNLVKPNKKLLIAFLDGVILDLKK